MAKGTVTYIDGRRVVLDEDGKPCRSCNSLLDFQAATGKTPSKPAAENPSVNGNGTTSTTSKNATTTTIPKGFNDCPPDVEALGRATWTFLHSMAAQYPVKASEVEQTEMKSFLNVFSKVYPCWYCADDFKTWLGSNQPKVSGRDELGNWLCDAHNEVNRKLNKPVFDCREWKARWRDGWNDGRC